MSGTLLESPIALSLYAKYSNAELPWGQMHMEDILQVKLDTIESVPVISAFGEVDVSSAPLLREQLAALPESERIVVVDLSEVSFLDSTGIGVLVGGLRRIQGAQPDGMLRLVVNRPHLLKVLEVTGLTTVFEIFPTLAEALA